MAVAAWVSYSASCCPSRGRRWLWWLIFNFTWAWNEFVGPLIYLNSSTLFPITLGLHRFMGRTQIDIQFLMAMTIVSTLVPIIIFFLTQRYFIQGIVITGIKG